MNTELNIGKAGEHLVIADLLLKGYPAALAGWGSKYDILVETPEKIIKVQVKTTNGMKRPDKRSVVPVYFFHTKRTGKGGKKHYQKGDFDCYAFVGLDTKAVFYLPFSEASKSYVSVRDKGNVHVGHNGGCRPGIYWQDLTWEDCLKKL